MARPFLQDNTENIYDQALGEISVEYADVSPEQPGAMFRGGVAPERQLQEILDGLGVTPEQRAYFMANFIERGDPADFGGMDKQLGLIKKWLSIGQQRTRIRKEREAGIAGTGVRLPASETKHPRETKPEEKPPLLGAEGAAFIPPPGWTPPAAKQLQILPEEKPIAHPREAIEEKTGDIGLLGETWPELQELVSGKYDFADPVKRAEAILRVGQRAVPLMMYGAAPLEWYGFDVATNVVKAAATGKRVSARAVLTPTITPESIKKKLGIEEIPTVWESAHKAYPDNPKLAAVLGVLGTIGEMYVGGKAIGRVHTFKLRQAAKSLGLYNQIRELAESGVPPKAIGEGLNNILTGKLYGKGDEIVRAVMRGKALPTIGLAVKTTEKSKPALKGPPGVIKAPIGPKAVPPVGEGAVTRYTLPKAEAFATKRTSVKTIVPKAVKGKAPVQEGTRATYTEVKSKSAQIANGVYRHIEHAAPKQAAPVAAAPKGIAAEAAGKYVDPKSARAKEIMDEVHAAGGRLREWVAQARGLKKVPKLVRMTEKEAEQLHERAQKELLKRAGGSVDNAKPPSFAKGVDSFHHGKRPPLGRENLDDKWWTGVHTRVKSLKEIKAGKDIGDLAPVSRLAVWAAEADKVFGGEHWGKLVTGAKQRATYIQKLTDIKNVITRGVKGRRQKKLLMLWLEGKLTREAARQQGLHAAYMGADREQAVKALREIMARDSGLTKEQLRKGWIPHIIQDAAKRWDGEGFLPEHLGTNRVAMRAFYEFERKRLLNLDYVQDLDQAFDVAIDHLANKLYLDGPVRGARLAILGREINLGSKVTSKSGHLWLQRLAKRSLEAKEAGREGVGINFVGRKYYFGGLGKNKAGKNIVKLWSLGDQTMHEYPLGDMSNMTVVVGGLRNQPNRQVLAGEILETLLGKRPRTKMFRDYAMRGVRQRFLDILERGKEAAEPDSLKERLTGKLIDYLSERSPAAYYRKLESELIATTYDALLGWNTSFMIRNQLGYAMTVGEVGTKNALFGLEEALRPGSKYGKMFDRYSHYAKEAGLRETERMHKYTQKRIWAKPYARFRGFMRWTTEKQERNLLRKPSWIAAFKRAKDAGKTDAAAGIYADWVLNKTNIMMGPLYQPYGLRALRRLPLGRIATQFLSWPAQQLLDTAPRWLIASPTSPEFRQGLLKFARATLFMGGAVYGAKKIFGVDLSDEFFYQQPLPQFLHRYGLTHVPIPMGGYWPYIRARGAEGGPLGWIMQRPPLALTTALLNVGVGRGTPRQRAQWIRDIQTYGVSLQWLRLIDYLYGDGRMIRLGYKKWKAVPPQKAKLKALGLKSEEDALRRKFPKIQLARLIITAQKKNDNAALARYRTVVKKAGYTTQEMIEARRSAFQSLKRQGYATGIK